MDGVYHLRMYYQIHYFKKGTKNLLSFNKDLRNKSDKTFRQTQYFLCELFLWLVQVHLILRPMFYCYYQYYYNASHVLNYFVFVRVHLFRVYRHTHTQTNMYQYYTLYVVSNEFPYGNLNELEQHLLSRWFREKGFCTEIGVGILFFFF